MPLTGLTGPRFGVHSPKPHLPPQALDAFVIHHIPTVLELDTQPPTPIEGPLQIEFIEVSHQGEVDGGGSMGTGINT